jgi:hypothetical protein
VERIGEKGGPLCNHAAGEEGGDCLAPLQAGLWAAALQEKEEGGRPPALKAAAADPAGTFTAVAAEAGDGEEPEEAVGDACTSEGGAGRAEEGAAGEPVSFTRSGGVESAPWR